MMGTPRTRGMARAPWTNPQSLAKWRMRERSRTKVARLKFSPPTQAPYIQAKSR